MLVCASKAPKWETIMKSTSYTVFDRKFTRISGKKLKRWKKKYSLEYFPLQVNYSYSTLVGIKNKGKIFRFYSLNSDKLFYDVFSPLDSLDRPVEIFFYHSNKVNDRSIKIVEGLRLIINKGRDAFSSESEMLYFNNTLNGLFDDDPIQEDEFNCFIRFKSKEEHMMYRLKR